jgi:hypothetical protein
MPFALFGCQQTSNNSAKGPSPQAIMVKVATQAQLCWFKKNDPAFTSFSMATELNSHAGRPRVLIVPKTNPAGLPKLVIQAERIVGISGVSTFGPLLDTSAGARIQDSVSKWAAGSKSC